jgi:hypothetical protein
MSSGPGPQGASRNDSGVFITQLGKVHHMSALGLKEMIGLKSQMVALLGQG